MVQPREAFVKAAMADLGASGCTKVSPFLLAQNYAELTERLEVFSDEIASAITIVKGGAGLLSELPEEQQALREDGADSLANFVLRTTLNDKHTSNKEQTLMEVFTNDVGVAVESLRSLEKGIRTQSTMPRTEVIAAVQNLIGLDHLVRAIPKIYNAIPAETQVAQDFVFRSH